MLALIVSWTDIPGGTSAVNVAKTVSIKVIETGLIYGAFNSVYADVELAFGESASPTNDILHSPTGQTAQPQSLGAKSQSSSLLGNYTPSGYLNATECRPTIISIGCCFVVPG